MRLSMIPVVILLEVPVTSLFSPRNPEFGRIQPLSATEGDDVCSADSVVSNDSRAEQNETTFWPFTLKRQAKDVVSDQNNGTAIIKSAHEHDKHHNENPALHQLDHRAKEKASFKLGETVAGQVVKTSERQIERQAEKMAERAAGRVERTMEKLVEKAAKSSGERAAETVSQRASERLLNRAAESIGEHTAERAGENIIRQWWRSLSNAVGHGAERSGERLIERGGERLGERAVERSLERGGERLGERAVERGLERGGERLGERLGERAVERGLERGGERLGERAVERGLERGGERLGERLGERAVEKGLERGGERLGERLGERAVERGLERGGERLGERAAERGLERSGERLGERLGERTVERGLERSGERIGEHMGERAFERATGTGTGKGIQRIFGVSSEKLAVRLGRGVLITLPILGGIFALYLLKSDIERLKEEWAIRVKTSSFFFLGAGVTDGIDSVLHFFIAFALFRHLSHHKLAVAEELSFACAIISTACAVVGEVVSLRIRKRRQDATLKTITDDDPSNALPIPPPSPLPPPSEAAQTQCYQGYTRHDEIVAIDRLITEGCSSDQLQLPSHVMKIASHKPQQEKLLPELYEDHWIHHTPNNNNSSSSSSNTKYGWGSGHCLPASALKDCYLYVTCEPCIMCSAALRQVGIGRVIFVCRNDRFRGCESILSLYNTSSSGNDAPYPITQGVLEEEAIQLLQSLYHRENFYAPDGK